MKQWFKDVWNWMVSGWKLFKYLIIFIIVSIVVLASWHFYFLKTIVNAQSSVVFVEQQTEKEQTKPLPAPVIKNKKQVQKEPVIEKPCTIKQEGSCIVVENESDDSESVFVNGVAYLFKSKETRNIWVNLKTGPKVDLVSRKDTVTINMDDFDNNICNMTIKKGKLKKA